MSVEDKLFWTFLISLTVGLLYWSYSNEKNFTAACAKKGGEVAHTHYRMLCLKPGTVIDVKE